MADINDPTQNVTIWNDAKGKNVTVTTDGSKERLDVSAAFTPASTVQVVPDGDVIHAFSDAPSGGTDC